MEIIARLANLPGALPGACAQGLIWGIMAIGVYLTYRILDVADLTVDGSFGTGGAVCVMCLLSGMNVWLALLVAVLAGLATGLVTGLLHTFMGIPAILAGILTQLALYSINLKIMGKANQSINVDKYGLLISLRWVKEFALLCRANSLTQRREMSRPYLSTLMDWLALPMIFRLMEYSASWVRIPARMAGMPIKVCSRPVTRPVARPASTATSNAAQTFMPESRHMTHTAPPVPKLPSTVRSATSRIR